MKRALIAVISIFATCTNVGAQTVQPRILIVTDSSTYRSFTSATGLTEYYSGTVDTASDFPSTFDQYDAVLLLYLRTNIDSIVALNLAGYLHHGGQLYAETWTHFLHAYYNWKDSTRLDDSLWRLCGLKREGQDAVWDNYDTVRGVDTEFTAGMKVAGQVSEPDTYFPHGDFQPVLYGYESEVIGGPGDIFAWIPIDTTIHAVMHYLLTGSKVYNDYYTVFMHRVLCNYFGLCEPVIPHYRGVEVANEQLTAITVSKEYYNILGVKIAEELRIGETPCKLLPNGQYFLKVTKGKQTTITPIVIQK